VCPAKSAPGAVGEGVPEADLDQLGVMLARLLATWWRSHQAEDEKAAVVETAAEEVRDGGARAPE
jgi:hypothetical protein